MNAIFITLMILSHGYSAPACPIPVPAIVKSEQPDNRILVFAENHESLAQRAYLKSILPELKNDGYNTLFIEAPSTLAVDREALARNLRSAPGILRQPDASIDAYLQLLDTAEDLGFTLHGYDTNVVWPWHTETTPPLRPFLKRFILKRNQKAAANISSYLQTHPKTKAVMLIGRLHLGIRNDPSLSAIRSALGKEADYDLTSLLSERTGVPVYSIALSGGDLGRAHRHPFALQAIQENAQNQWRFALTRGQYSGNLFLHIPQGEHEHATSLASDF